MKTLDEIKAELAVMQSKVPKLWYAFQQAEKDNADNPVEKARRAWLDASQKLHELEKAVAILESV
jgi:hypothetical protein